MDFYKANLYKAFNKIFMPLFYFTIWKLTPNILLLKRSMKKIEFKMPILKYSMNGLTVNLNDPKIKKYIF
jgi:hypothetical protein